MRLGGFAAFAFVALGAYMRLLAPQSPGSTSLTVHGKAGAALASSTDKKADPKQTPPAGKATDQAYPVALKERIRDFYGQSHSPNVADQKPPCTAGDLDNHWCVPG